MNKILILSVLTLFIIAAAFILIKPKKSPLPADNQSVGSPEPLVMEEKDGMMENAEKIEDNDSMMADRGTYLDYSKESFEANSNKRRVIFFHASWCPTCRPADADFKANKDLLPSDLALFRANYDIEKSLKKRYNVTYQHTFVQVDKNSNKVTKWNGGQIEELLSNIK